MTSAAERFEASSGDPSVEPPVAAAGGDADGPSVLTPLLEKTSMEAETKSGCYVAERDDFLEVSLCGNDTRLFVRETAEDCRPRGDPSKCSTPSVLTGAKVSHVTEASVIRSERSGGTDRPPAKADKPEDVLKALYHKKWSGRTYFEEELARMRDKEYQRGVEEAEARRRMWRAFQRELARESRRDLIRSSGPAWWQEPSPEQIELAVRLGDVIKEDHEEAVTIKTRQWLLDLGITIRFTPKQVRQCIRKSLLDPVDFLLEAHSVVLKTQLGVKKKRGDLERPFSINERILLSAVCVLQLPTLLMILNYILPPPEPLTESRFLQELLYGDLNDDSVRHATPYMEPLPFRDTRRFDAWAWDGVFRSFLPTILREEAALAREQRSTRATLMSAKMSLASRGRNYSTALATEVRPTDASSTSRSPTVYWLISHCASKCLPSASMAPLASVDSESETTPRFFVRNLTKKFTHRPTFSEVIRCVSTAAPGKASFVSRRSSSDRPTPSTLSSRPATVVTGSASASSADTRDFAARESGAIRRSERSVRASSKSYVTYPPLDQDADEDVDKVNEKLRKVWEEFKDVPEKDKLQHALQLLAELGDPLAQLPELHTLPSVRRWLELRKGKNRILSKEKKDELLRRSRAMWKVAPTGRNPKGPKIPCSKRTERKLTWDKKRWLERKVKKEMDSYCTRVRQEKVDTTRSFFPSMLNHYDYGSKLNRNFREAFFTYLPSREADTFVYKPWQPMDVKGE